MNNDEDVGRGLNFGWLIEGEAAGCAAPAFQEDLTYLRSQGVTALLRLAHPDTDFVMQHTQIAGAGLNDLQVPVRDYDAPSPGQIEQALHFMREQHQKGGAVAVSCGAGCGRTGTILACYLITHRYTADEALELLLSNRPCSSEILRSVKQKHAIYEFETRFKSGEARF